MLKNYTFIFLFLAASLAAQAQITDLHHLASYSTGSSDAAEVVAFDPDSKKVFFTSGDANELGILDIRDPQNPTLITNISLAAYGGGPNSVDVKNGIVAVAMEANTSTDPGSVVFFDTAGVYLNEVLVGALPDMLLFTNNGNTILTANEGEPSDDYSIDPNGSVSIIDISNGVGSAVVNTLDFTSYNDKKVSLTNKGIRIFGNNGAASVSEDLEPEFITVTEDGNYAYINCQENNALALLDLNTEEIVDILPLGYKNHLLGTPQVDSYVLNNLVTNWPTLGTPAYNGGQPPVMLGGFSGMYYDASQSNATQHVFYVIPDRGPNDAVVSKSSTVPASSQNLRPFKLPNYQGRVVKFTLNSSNGTVTLNNQILLTRADSVTPISGRGNIPGFDEVPVTYSDVSTSYSDTDYSSAGVIYHELAYDEFGGDFEGILIDKNGDFWMCDEYRPAIYQFSSNGVMKKRYVPSGTSNLGNTPQPVGTYGDETLPAVYAKRRANRGFEAIAYDSDKHVVYAFIQSPLYNPSSSTKNNSDVIRILGIDANTGMPAEEYIYLLERNQYAGFSSSRVDKIGDAVYTGNGKFLVLERDSEGPTVAVGKKYVYEINLKGATNIHNTAFSPDTLEAFSADELASMGIQAVYKTKVVNLPSVGYNGSDKAEGVALLPNNQIAVINDNDFGLAGAGITDNSVLGIVSFDDDYSFDASNRDNGVNITNHPTLGMYMPDAISSFESGGINYIITANEGDARDYDGYSEEERVKDLVLDTVAYPNASALQQDADLGRLKTTTAHGDYDGDGAHEQIYSYGARSFSIFDPYGNLVFDSGNQFALETNSQEPALFNEDEGEFDNRSDDKGVEPEAVTVGKVGNNTYAFIGFERQSAIVMYDITDPKSPQFITYYNTREVDTSGAVSGDVSPEIIKFVPASESPNSENLLVVGYEVSGTVGLIQVGGQVFTTAEELRQAQFDIYPNPVTSGSIQFSTEVSGVVYNELGQSVLQFSRASSLNVDKLSRGMYIIKTEEMGVQRFLKF
jgi:hypothetical protein